MKKINVLVSFTNSKKYPTDWKLRTEYKDGYKTLFIIDEISKNTRFGESPSVEDMKKYATDQIETIANSLEIDVDIIFK